MNASTSNPGPATTTPVSGPTTPSPVPGGPSTPGTSTPGPSSNGHGTSSPSTPRITVLMSVYNEPERFLRESIDSILRQTYRNFEFIIILDNPDNLI